MTSRVQSLQKKSISTKDNPFEKTKQLPNRENSMQELRNVLVLKDPISSKTFKFIVTGDIKITHEGSNVFIGDDEALWVLAPGRRYAGFPYPPLSWLEPGIWFRGSVTDKVLGSYPLEWLANPNDPGQVALKNKLLSFKDQCTPHNVFVLKLTRDLPSTTIDRMNVTLDASGGVSRVSHCGYLCQLDEKGCLTCPLGKYSLKNLANPNDPEQVVLRDKVLLWGTHGDTTSLVM